MLKGVCLTAASALLAGCASLPVSVPADFAGYKSLHLAVLQTPVEGLKAAIFEDAVARLVRHFGGVSVVASVEEARQTQADLFATVSIDSRLATSIMGTSRVDVRATLTTLDGRMVDKIIAEGSQRGRPPLMTDNLNDSARALALRDFEGKLSRSPKLVDFMASRGVKPAPAASAASSVIDRPGYRLAERPHDFALVVGIEKYSSLPDAEFAQRDAEAVREHLAALGFPRRNTVSLMGSQALRSALEKYLESWFPRNVKEDSRVLIYFSGHGAPDAQTSQAYLVPWDGDAKFLPHTGYPLKRLYEKLRTLKAREVIVVLDTCFSGSGGRSILAKGVRPLVTQVDLAGGAAGNLTVLSASAADEITGTEESSGHGLFTHYFLKALNDRQGKVSVKVLFDFLAPRVQEAARRENRDQTPQLLPPDPDGLSRVRFGE